MATWLHYSLIIVQQWSDFGTSIMFLALVYMIVQFGEICLLQVECALWENRPIQEIVELYYDLLHRYGKIISCLHMYFVFDTFFAFKILFAVWNAIEELLSMLDVPVFGRTIFGGQDACMPVKPSGLYQPQYIMLDTIYSCSWLALFVYILTKFLGLTTRLIQTVPKIMCDRHFVPSSSMSLMIKPGSRIVSQISPEQLASNMALITRCMESEPFELALFGWTPNLYLFAPIVANLLGKLIMLAR